MHTHTTVTAVVVLGILICPYMINIVFFFLWNECLLMDKCCVSWYVRVFEE